MGNHENLEKLKDLKRKLEFLGKLKIIAGMQKEPGKNLFGDDITADDFYMMLAHVHEYGVKIKVDKNYLDEKGHGAMRRYLHATGLHLKDSTKFINIPERAFIRKTRNSSSFKNSLKAELNILGAGYLKGDINEQELVDEVGVFIVREITANMGDKTKSLHEYSVKKKKEKGYQGDSNNALVGTGELRRHITYRKG